MDILIADSGSTKTHWLIKRYDGEVNELFSAGINPYFLNADGIVDIVSESFQNINIANISKIYFYGAGCSNGKETIVNTALKTCFKHADVISVENDLLASARALYGNNPGVACILGTGSNAGVYSGSEFSSQIMSLGYVLGDEGSGAYLGRKLLMDYFRNEMPSYVSEKFQKIYDIKLSDVLERVYKKDFPNRYLASFAKFLGENKNEEYIRKIVKTSFEDFVKYQLLTLDFDKTKYEISFVGSVAYHFKDILNDILVKYSLNLGEIMRKPMDGLVDFHRLN